MRILAGILEAIYAIWGIATYFGGDESRGIALFALGVAFGAHRKIMGLRKP